MNIFDRLAFEEAKKNLQNNEDIYIETCHIVAKALRQYYEALLEKGFTSEQALQMVIAQQQIILSK